MYHSFLIHSSDDGHLGCLHVLATVNSAVMNIGVHVSLSILVSSVCMPSSGIARWYGSSISSFLRNLHTVLPEKAMAPHSSTLAWKIPWTEEPGRLQPMRSLRVGHYWATSLSLFTFMHWRRMATHPSVLAWRIPGTGEPDGLPSLGSHRVGHDWSDLAVAAADGQKGIDYKLGVFLTSDYLAITTLKITVKDEAQEETGSLEPKP